MKEKDPNYIQAVANYNNVIKGFPETEVKKIIDAVNIYDHLSEKYFEGGLTLKEQSDFEDIQNSIYYNEPIVSAYRELKNIGEIQEIEKTEKIEITTILELKKKAEEQKGRHLTVREIAYIVGIPYGTLKSMNHQDSTPIGENAEKIAAFLGGKPPRRQFLASLSI